MSNLTDNAGGQSGNQHVQVAARQGAEGIRFSIAWAFSDIDKGDHWGAAQQIRDLVVDLVQRAGEAEALGLSRPDAERAWAEIAERKPPGGNTGGKFTAYLDDAGTPVKVDWLNGTFPAEHREAVTALCEQHLKQPGEDHPGRHTYHIARTFASSAFIAWTPGRKEALLSLNGDSIDLIPTGQQLAFFKALAKLKFKATRIDVAWDDYERMVTMDQIHAAASQGNFAGYRRHESRRPMSSGEPVGDSIYFGRPGREGSGRMLNIYDKKLETGGEIDAIRYEHRLYKDHAAEAFKLLCEQEDEAGVARMIGRMIAGSIDFLEREGKISLARMKRIGWWADIVAKLGEGLRLVVHRVITPLQKSWEAFKRGWPKKLKQVLIVTDSMGIDLMEIIRDMIDGAPVDWTQLGKIELKLNQVECFG